MQLKVNRNESNFSTFETFLYRLSPIYFRPQGKMVGRSRIQAGKILPDLKALNAYLF